MVKGEKEIPETDQEPGALHPRLTYAFVGHEVQEAMLAEALAGHRMHHAWMLSGPKGLGKATLAYRFARAALGAKRIKGGRPLDVDPEDEIARKIAAQAHPDLFVLRRGYNERGRPRREITVDDARELGHFFSMAPAQGGMRVAIIDSVDDLNRNAANAILKTLEEPPAQSVLLLVCHAPGAALATIRSRCRRLALKPLSDERVREALGGKHDGLVTLAKGRPGRAIALHAQGVEAAGTNFADVAKDLARGQARAVVAPLYERMHGEPFEKLSAVLDLTAEWARGAGVEQNSEAWADAWSALEQLRAEAEDLDMDPRHALGRAIGILERAASARR